MKLQPQEKKFLQKQQETLKNVFSFDGLVVSGSWSSLTVSNSSTPTRPHTCKRATPSSARASLAAIEMGFKGCTELLRHRRAFYTGRCFGGLGKHCGIGPARLGRRAARAKSRASRGSRATRAAQRAPGGEAARPAGSVQKTTPQSRPRAASARCTRLGCRRAAGPTEPIPDDQSASWRSASLAQKLNFVKQKTPQKL